MINKGLKETKKPIIRIIILTIVLVLGGIMVSQDANAQAQTKTYFRFDIPLSADGSRIKYSPGWFGASDKCPQNVTVVYYNDKEGYGVAYTTDIFITKQATLTTAKVADDTVAAAKDEAGIYYGEKIASRWYPEVKVEEYKVDEKDNIVTGDVKEIYNITTKKAVVCPVCGSFMFWYYDGLLSGRQVISCPLGHESVTVSYETLEARSIEFIK